MSHLQRADYFDVSKGTAGCRIEILPNSGFSLPEGSLQDCPSHYLNNSSHTQKGARTEEEEWPLMITCGYFHFSMVDFHCNTDLFKSNFLFENINKSM